MSSSTSHHPFRLLIRAPDDVDPDLPALRIDGTRWVATPFAPVPEPGAVPPYTCISYSWGQTGVPNPFGYSLPMSYRTLPAIEATIRALNPPAIWVDALCVPPSGAARVACLRSMGTLYGRATQVSVVLSPESGPVLDGIAASGPLDEATLLVLEKDEWVTRAWTYQELVNSLSVQFIAEGRRPTAVHGEDFLNKVGEAIERFKQAHGWDSFSFRAAHPRLDSLEDLLADWRTAGQLERSAYQVMSSLDRRVALDPDDHFNAMIDALTSTPPGDGDLLLCAPEYFMRVCEAKQDFSFIYCAAPRSLISGRGWRPEPGPMPALLPWHSWGEGQWGELFATHVELHGMRPMARGPLGAEAVRFVNEWLDSDHAAPSDRPAAVRTLERLRLAGFSGWAEPIELEHGYFFPQRALAEGEEVEVFVAAGIRWVHGSPGLLATRVDGKRMRLREVGVFIGGPGPERQSIHLE